MDTTWILEGLGCANCAEKIRAEVEGLDGIQSAEINFMSKKLRIHTEKDLPQKDLQKLISKIAHKHEPDIQVLPEGGERKDDKGNSFRGEIIRVCIGIALYLAAVLLPLSFVPELVLLMASYLLVGGEVLLRAGKNILKGQVFDENFLMAIATIGAIAIGEYPEAAAVMLFYQVGELFQDYAVNRSRKSIAGLMDIRPDSANIKSDSGVITVSPEEVKVGDILVIRPGEKVALDGVVEKGVSALDTRALTGESIPRTIEPGADVLSGCINLSGLLEVRVTKPFGESTVSKILDLVENAGNKKAKAENFITRFARVYTPAVVGIAALLAVIPPLFFGQPFQDWLYRALAFLVVSCPCALVISIPLGFFGGIGGASRHGILVKGSSYLEALAKCKTVVFDKTGTLTKGIFEVTGISPSGISEEKLLEYAALAESASNHPIAQSIQRAYGKPLPTENLVVEEIAGKGVKTVFAGDTLLAGNAALMALYDIEAAPAAGSTVVHVAVNGAYAGFLEISDCVKPDAKDAIERLRRDGVRTAVMLTGDSEAAAKKVTGELGLDKAYAQLLPQDKVEKVEALLGELPTGEKLAFVGDGINDAPVLARADIGIAMGALGSDAAIEAADIVLMNDELSKLSVAIQIAKKTIRIVKQNIILAMGIKIAVLILAALGFASMWAAVFADVGVAFLAILNAMRCMRFKTRQ